MRFAFKLLKRSDLTFFEYQFRRQNAGNQKSLNLSRRVFIDVLFPSAPDIAQANGAGGAPKAFHLPLTIYGPGERAEPQRLSRSVLPKTRTQKNWRLNGEFVPDPDFDPDRYHGLLPEDVAVLAFEGEAYPTAVTIVLLSQSEAADTALRTAAMEELDGRSMAAVEPGTLLSIIERSAPPHHPIRELLDLESDEALAEAAEGSAEGVRRLRASGSLRRMSAEALERARRAAQDLGREGEVLLSEWLEGEVQAGNLQSATWISEQNAVCPWDFEVEEPDGTLVRIEAKTTRGPFEREFHISQAELEAACEPGAPRTDLYRISDLAPQGGRLRIIRGIAETARRVCEKAAELGDGIVPDAYTVRPDRFGLWEEPRNLVAPEPEEEE
ncbi:DUF3883 domain-containing protein [Xanthobacter autotrophicus]|uniref:protein NO VEIN domain-containing protein n=1 Tax=Xanthobacter TaxID=279 RepID=UPI0024AB97FE|nr:DUF3883 domain-containing protein [Xanthobacter autotrophicus]MDI4666583.1 DUF3883 domain-containing protein [Xanthobacter autotrophicus]